jgi:hypothetical protein
MTTIKPPAGPDASPTAAHMPSHADEVGSSAGQSGIPAPGTAGPPAEAGATGSATASQRLHAQVSTQAADPTAPGHPAVQSATVDGVGPSAGLAPAGARLVDLAAAVERGQLSMAQAIDQLVDHTVDGLGQHLSEAERLDLSDLLQGALSSDPTFGAMRGEQG